MNQSNASLATSVKSHPPQYQQQDNSQVVELVGGILKLFTDLIDGLYFDMLVELDSPEVSLSRKVDIVEMVYRRGQLFSTTQQETLISRIKMRMSKVDFVQNQVNSVAGVRMSLMFKQEAQRGAFKYDTNPLLNKNSPIQYASCFNKWYRTSIKRCKLSV